MSAVIVTKHMIRDLIAFKGVSGMSFAELIEVLERRGAALDPKLLTQLIDEGRVDFDDSKGLYFSKESIE
jgi:hypothetical protein